MSLSRCVFKVKISYITNIKGKTKTIETTNSKFKFYNNDYPDMFEYCFQEASKLMETHKSKVQVLFPRKKVSSE